MTKVDNGEANKKILLRELVMPSEAKVLDLFCGESGEMYKACYRQSKLYVGIDLNGGHGLGTCYKMNNKEYLAMHGCSGFNMIDIDAYGSSWWQLGYIINNTDQNRISIACTDGQNIDIQRRGKFPKVVAASECVPPDFKAVAAFYFYNDIFKHYIASLCEANNFTISKYNSVFKKRKQVLYSSFILDKKT